MFACYVFIVVCVFCILFVFCFYCCLLGVLNLMMMVISHGSGSVIKIS